MRENRTVEMTDCRCEKLAGPKEGSKSKEIE